MTCKDCVHYDICVFCLRGNENEKCLHFKNNANVVEVVRCRDCKWYEEGKLLSPNKFCFRLKHPTEDRKIGYNYAPDDYCSYGERKEE